VEALAEREARAWQEQTRQRWESLRLELKTKLQLLHKTLEQEHKQPVETPHMKTPYIKTPLTLRLGLGRWKVSRHMSLSSYEISLYMYIQCTFTSKAN